ncbi:mercury resistance system transport protein MerF [Onishia taeanensis]|nr:mercury resistance system transport protein MerF [Halomonas taeanensis]
MVLLPALAFFIGLTLYALWRKKQYDACCNNASTYSRNSPHE